MRRLDETNETGRSWAEILYWKKYTAKKKHTHGSKKENYEVLTPLLLLFFFHSTRWMMDEMLHLPATSISMTFCEIKLIIEVDLWHSLVERWQLIFLHNSTLKVKHRLQAAGYVPLQGPPHMVRTLFGCECWKFGCFLATA